MSRRLIAASSTAFVLCLLMAMANPTAAGATTAACAPRCGGPAQVSGNAPRPEPVTCLHDAGCGGGLALGLGAASGVALIVVAAPFALGALAGRRERFSAVRQPTGRVPAGGLFRPPRILFDV